MLWISRDWYSGIYTHSLRRNSNPLSQGRLIPVKFETDSSENKSNRYRFTHTAPLPTEFLVSATVLHFRQSAQLQMEYKASTTVLSFKHSTQLQPKCSASDRVIIFTVLRKLSRRRLCFHEALLQRCKDLLEQMYKITSAHMFHLLKLWSKFWSSGRKMFLVSKMVLVCKNKGQRVAILPVFFGELTNCVLAHKTTLIVGHNYVHQGTKDYMGET